MNQTLEELEKELADMEIERNKENMNRINNMAALWKAQDKLGGSFFGITIPKAVQDFDNTEYNNLFVMINKKMKYLEGVYASKNSYDEATFLNETKGVSEAEFKAISDEIKTAMATIKGSNVALTTIWNNEMKIGYKINSRKEMLTFYSDRVLQVESEIIDKENQIAADKKYKEEKEKAGLLPHIDSVYLTDKIKSNEEAVARLKSELAMIYTKRASKNEIEAYRTQVAKENIEREQEEENKAIAEKARAEEAEKQRKFAEIREARKENIAADLTPTGESIEEEIPEAELAAAGEDLRTPEPEKKPEKISKASDFLKKLLNSNVVKAVAITAACAIAVAAGIAWAPGLMLGGTALYGYNEIKKGMGK